MKKQFSSKTISITFCIFVLLFVLGFYVVAWEEPASAPPDGNVYAPINTGNSNQYKEGRLGVYTNEIDEGFGLTIGRMGREGGIKATGYSWFDGDIDTSGDIDAGGQICDSTGCIGGLGGSLWTQSGTNIYYDSDNVGIGTVAPGAKLEINKSGLGLYLNQPAAADIYMRYHVPGVRWWTVGSKANGDFWFSNASDLSASGPLTLTSGGNVGIGTASPGYKLTVNGPIGTPNMNHPYLVLDSSGSGSNTNEQSAQISLGESGRGSASLHLAYTGDGYSYIGMGDLGPDNIPDHWAMKLY